MSGMEAIGPRVRDIRAVDPFTCRMWEFHDRLESSVNETTCRNEIQSIAARGQLVPVLARALQGDPDHAFELIYGARRLFVARHLRRPLLVEVREISDRDAIVAMDLENRHRKDISPYERGMSYARWLRIGQFCSQDEISEALDISASQVSRLLKLARLPTVIVDAFGCGTNMRESWGLELSQLLEQPDTSRAILARARIIAARPSRPTPLAVYRSLMMASTRRRNVIPSSREEVYRDELGTPLFRIRHRTNTVSILLPTNRVSTPTLARIRSSLADLLRTPQRSAESTPTKGRMLKAAAPQTGD